MSKKTFEVEGRAAVDAVERWLAEPVVPKARRKSWWRRVLDWWKN